MCTCQTRDHRHIDGRHEIKRDANVAHTRVHQISSSEEIAVGGPQSSLRVPRFMAQRRPRVRESVAKGAGEARAASGRRSPHLEVMWKAHQILLHHRFAFIKPKHWPLWESRV